MSMQDLRTDLPVPTSRYHVILSGYNPARTSKAIEWCEENIGKSGWSCCGVEEPIGVSFAFQDSDHSLWFSMVWG
jgi:hypothetical protein